MLLVNRDFPSILPQGKQSYQELYRELTSHKSLPAYFTNGNHKHETSVIITKATMLKEFYQGLLALPTIAGLDKLPPLTLAMVNMESKKSGQESISAHFSKSHNYVKVTETTTGAISYYFVGVQVSIMCSVEFLPVHENGIYTNKIYLEMSGISAQFSDIFLSKKPATFWEYALGRLWRAPAKPRQETKWPRRRRPVREGFSRPDFPQCRGQFIASRRTREIGFWPPPRFLRAGRFKPPRR
ncbi:hypothetical protein [Rhodoblastus sp.]|uniref:hypothetical protein n=1 Tax=Rhodoblastus sp. TaxID=1962975 RepID=UPI003F9E088D